MKTVTLRLTKLLRSFKRDRDGASAVEFAILAPLLITLYFGCVEITDGIAADRKVTLTAGALANLTSQSQTITVDGMTNILNASAAIIKPYSVGNLAATITCLKIDDEGIAKVKWSRHLERYGAHDRLQRNASIVGARGSEFLPGVERGELQLYADRGLHDYGYVAACGPDVHEPAHHAAGLRQQDLHLNPIFVRKSGQDPASGVV